MDKCFSSGVMLAMVASSTPPVSRRPRTNAIVLLTVILGIFVWGLVMFVIGRHTVVNDTRAEERETERTIALSWLYRFDRALADHDCAGAERILADMPATTSPEITEFRAVRRRALDAAKAAPPWEFLRIVPDLQQGHAWWAVGRNHRGTAVLVSTDSGVHWRDLPWPADTDHQAELLGLSGDGRLLATLPKNGQNQLFVITVDGTWTALGDSQRALICAPLTSEALMLADVQDHETHRLHISVDCGKTWTVAPDVLQPYLSSTMRSERNGNETQIIFADGRAACFSTNDGAFLRLTDAK